MGFPSGASGKEPNCQCRRHTKFGFDPKIPGGGDGNPFQYSCWENPMDGQRSLPGYSLQGHTEPNMTEESQIRLKRLSTAQLITVTGK